jgi:hypothetical protein
MRREEVEVIRSLARRRLGWRLVLTTATAGACGALSGCAGPKRAPEEPSAPPSSLVYSPGAKITAEREAQASRPPAGDILRTGVKCRVHLRRDAAGLAGGAPLSIVGASMLSERASVAGTIDRVEADGITLRGDGSTYWIPRDVILAVEFPNEPLR